MDALSGGSHRGKEVLLTILGRLQCPSGPSRKGGRDIAQRKFNKPVHIKSWSHDRHSTKILTLLDVVVTFSRQVSALHSTHSGKEVVFLPRSMGVGTDNMSAIAYLIPRGPMGPHVNIGGNLSGLGTDFLPTLPAICYPCTCIT